MTDGQYAELRALEGRLAWLAPWVRWSVSVANADGCRILRRVPLGVCALLVWLELWRLRHALP